MKLEDVKKMFPSDPGIEETFCIQKSDISDILLFLELAASIGWRWGTLSHSRIRFMYLLEEDQ